MKFGKINDLTLIELKRLQGKIAGAIEGYETRKKSEALPELQEKAKELSFNLSDLLGTRKTSKSSGPAGSKYRHPENPEITWSARGRTPGWFQADGGGEVSGVDGGVGMVMGTAA